MKVHISQFQKQFCKSKSGLIWLLDIPLTIFLLVKLNSRPPQGMDMEAL